MGNLKTKNTREITMEKQVDNLLYKHYFESHFFDDARREELAKCFQENSYVKINNFAPAVIETIIKGEVYELLQKYAVRRNVQVKATSNTPRIMNNVGQPIIAQEAQLIPTLYHSKVLMQFLSVIVGRKVTPCPYEKEKFVINQMSKKGDTHGWHWDDYSYSFVWLLESPPPELGGVLEIVPNTRWDKSNPRVEYYLEKFPILQRHHSTGDTYLIKGDTTMHRVAPLKKDVSRVILSIAWANEDDLNKQISHETMIEMYDY